MQFCVQFVSEKLEKAITQTETLVTSIMSDVRIKVKVILISKQFGILKSIFRQKKRPTQRVAQMAVSLSGQRQRYWHMLQRSSVSFQTLLWFHNSSTIFTMLS
jgi:hypothetical protein